MFHLFSFILFLRQVLIFGGTDLEDLTGVTLLVQWLTYGLAKSDKQVVDLAPLVSGQPFL